MKLNYNTIVSSVFATLAVWTIFAAMPYFRLIGPYPQVDTQILFLHSLCALMFFYFAFRILCGKYHIENLNHPFIILPFSLVLLSFISSLFSDNFNISIAGSLQIGQGAFWYLDLMIMAIIFSQVTNFKKIRFIFFINLLLVTTVVSFFTFFPEWKGLPFSFYYFTDYLCFYGVLSFILLTTITKRFYMHIICFMLLGAYFLFLDNRAAIFFWVTTILVALSYYFFIFFKKNNIMNKIKLILFSDFMFVFIIIFISILIFSTSIIFWSEDFRLSPAIKGTLLDAPVVRGKIIETSLYSLNNLQNFLIGNGWGFVPDLILENMSPWQYDELRLNYNLHFHTHNEIAEHLVSIGLVGTLFYIMYVYYIFKFSGKLNFSSKLAWLLFFKINCFWFMWIGTFAAFAVVTSCLIIYDKKPIIRQIDSRFLVRLICNKFIISAVSICLGCIVLYGSYLTYKTIKINSLLNYTSIIQYLDNKKQNNDKVCLSFYANFNRGGYLLNRLLNGYNAHIISLNKDDIHEIDLKVLNELQCKANELIRSNNFTSSLLATAVQVDTDYYYKFGDAKFNTNLVVTNYKNWLLKANILAEVMPNRGDLLLPFLSYAINKNKSNDALNICKKNIKRLEAYCYLIRANVILADNDLDRNKLQNSLKLINKSIKSGLFDELIYGLSNCNVLQEFFCNPGLQGVPLAPNTLFLISDEEKLELEKLVATQQ